MIPGGGSSLCREKEPLLSKKLQYDNKSLLLIGANSPVKPSHGDFLGGPLAGTASFQCRSSGFNPWPGN